MGLLDTLSRIGLVSTKGLVNTPASLMKGSNPTAQGSMVEPAGGGGLLSGLRNAVSGPGSLDRWAMLGAQFQDLGDGGERAQSIQARQLAAQQLATQTRAREALNAALMGQSGRTAGGASGAAAANFAGMMTQAGQPAQAASAPAAGLPSLRELAPALIAAQQAGVPGVDDLVSILDKTGPQVQVANGVAFDPRATPAGTRVGVDLTNINGTLRDTQDPNNANVFTPNVGEGQELVYGANGQPMVRMIPGYVEGRGQLAANVAGSTAAAQAPYQVNTVTGPNGEQITTSNANILGGGPIYGQSEAAQQQAITEAQGQGEAAVTRAERQRNAPARIQRYEEALSLIPQAITGPGADIRLAGARALAAAGNDDARRAVAATEVYQNLINRDLGSIIKDMVGGANVSNADRMIAERVAGGDTNLTPEALQRIVTLALNTQRGYLQGSNTPVSGQGSRGSAPPPPPGFVLD